VLRRKHSQSRSWQQSPPTRRRRAAPASTYFMMSRTRPAVSLGVLPTRTPAFSSASFLACRGAGRAGDDRAGVTHRLAFGRGEPGHVADDRLGHVLLDVGGRPRSSASPPISPIITIASVSGSSWNACEAVDVRGADHRVAADADGGGEADVAQLVHHLVGQRAGLGDQADPALGTVMSAGMMPALDLPGEATPGQFGPMMLVFCPPRSRAPRTRPCRAPGRPR
jgi:hypothetical protein